MISISLATLACNGRARRKEIPREWKREKPHDICTKGTISVPSVKGGKAMEELSISLQDISMDGMGILYQIVKLNILYHMSFFVSYSSNIVCITPPPSRSTPYWVRNLAEASLAFMFAVLKPLWRRERQMVFARNIQFCLSEPFFKRLALGASTPLTNI